METNLLLSGVSKRKCIQIPKLCAKKEKKASIKRVALILQKCESQRTEDERILLLTCEDEIAEIESRQARTKKIKDRCQEVEDPPDLLGDKCKLLIEAVSKANHLIVYTGAGISTSAQIPDYRGSQGIWTLLQKGKEIGNHDLSLAEPTLTHMALYELHKKGFVKYIVSQNCDGLHLRSGLPKAALSEVHGNMYIEVCRKCQPTRPYWRLFDTTELTGRYAHKTRRKCRHCGDALVDSIVHFGERGTLPWPLNWKGAIRHSEQADVILCLGSSLKVLKRYPWLWAMDRPAKKRPKIYIVNLQWTPKDECAILKINGRCDEVIKRLMAGLQIDIPTYERHKDPLFAHATPLQEEEQHTTTQPVLTKCKVSKENIKIEATEMKNVASYIAKSECDVEVDCKSENITMEHDKVENSEASEIKTEVDKVKIDPCDSSNDYEQILKNNDSNNIIVDQQNISCNSLLNDQDSLSIIPNHNFSINNSPTACDKHLKHSNYCTKLETLPDNNINLNIIESSHDLNDEVQGNTKVVLDDKIFPNQSILVSPTKSSLFSIDSILNSTKSPNNKDNIKSHIAKIENSETEIAPKKIKLVAADDPQDFNRTTVCHNKYDPSIKSTSRSKYLNNFIPPNYQHDFHINSISQISQQNLLNRIFMNPVQQSYISSESISHPFTFGYYEALMNYYATLNQRIEPQLGHSKLVYSGLHSIIPINENISAAENTAYQDIDPNFASENAVIKKKNKRSSLTNKKSEKKEEDPESYITNNEYDISQQKPKQVECDFCQENYHSFICLFYKREQDFFRIKVERKGKSIFCVCCDYTDSSEDDELNNKVENTLKNEVKLKTKISEELTNAKVKSDDSDSLAENEEEKIDDKSNKIQAGWFGKGYRKNRKKRRM